MGFIMRQPLNSDGSDSNQRFFGYMKNKAGSTAGESREDKLDVASL
jgi:hypothetical protein